MKASLTVALAVLALLAILLSGAFAQDRAAWFKSLKQPGAGISCCDVSDCKVTEAVYQAGAWWAMSRAKKALIPVPDEKVLRSPMSIDGEAYLCESGVGSIFCLIPPNMGY